MFEKQKQNITSAAEKYAELKIIDGSDSIWVYRNPNDVSNSGDLVGIYSFQGNVEFVNLGIVPNVECQMKITEGRLLNEAASPEGKMFKRFEVSGYNFKEPFYYSEQNVLLTKWFEEQNFSTSTKLYYKLLEFYMDHSFNSTFNRKTSNNFLFELTSKNEREDALNDILSKIYPVYREGEAMDGNAWSLEKSGIYMKNK